MKIAALGRNRHSRRALAAVLAAGAGLTLAACGPGVATPVPEPPTLQLGKIGGPSGGQPNVTSVGGRTLFGDIGAAPAGSVVRVTNLDRKDPVVVSSAKADGSFNLGLEVLDGEELRFDWVRGTERGAPQDAHFVQGPRLDVYHVEPSRRFSCVGLSPGFAVGFDGGNEQSLVVSNGCASDITLSAPRLRLGLADFKLVTQLPASIAAGQSGTLDLSFTRSLNGAREDTLFIDVTSEGEVIRYPVTLHAAIAP